MGRRTAFKRRFQLFWPDCELLMTFNDLLFLSPMTDVVAEAMGFLSLCLYGEACTE